MISAVALIGFVMIGVALAGGLYASYVNIRNARGPRERKFVIRACAVGWALILSMLAVIYWLPAPYRYVAALIYFLAIPVLIYRWALTHQMIRLLDERDREATT